ncbi:MAG: hypothetical protein LLF98_12585 [Clostridium sp.]|uniref:hypothetical protein n=1 Tax=Clostridium sp. TaxID=1506 RepID=UPI0025B91756|nr:hypothetical protein [Clostridium sp.]MCE5222055.1 hypothetical protein [Clostridium sp.]
MKVINKKAEREKEIIENNKKSPAAISSKKADKARQQEEEKKACTIRVVLDWRVSGQLDPITKGIWEIDTTRNRENFLKTAIENRKQIEELYVEPFDYIVGGNIRAIEVEYDKDTIEMLSNEASKAGLGFNEYVTSIVYTTAFNINQEREKAKAISDADTAERTPFMISEGYISQELKRKLESKYGMPKGLLIPKDIHTNMLIDLAKEYFGIEK